MTSQERLVNSLGSRPVDHVQDREFLCRVPLVEGGGYIPHCDHLCPADVSLEKNRSYLRKKREIFGMPEETTYGH